MSKLKDLIGHYRFKKRFEILNYLIRTRGYRDYLEIGVCTGRCIQRIKGVNKTGVDPEPQVEPTDWTLRRQTSDDFFASNDQQFDLVFIDGLHWCEQVLADILNSVAALRPDGAVLVHDCNPLTEEAQSRDLALIEKGGWNGDGWKAIAWLRQFAPELFCGVIDRDHGLGYISVRKGQSCAGYTPEVREAAAKFFPTVGWSDLAANREELIGIIPDRRTLEARLAAG